MSGSAGEDEDDAARAFENLREEVASLRRGIELVYQQGQDAKSVDYSLTLGSMAKSLQAVQGRLEAIESKPALAMTPEVYRERIEAMGQVAGQVAGRALSEGAAAQNEATRELKETLGRARSKRGQREWLVVVGVLGVMVGILLWTLLVENLPWGAGTWLAAVLQDEAIGTAEARDLADAYIAWFQMRARWAQAVMQWNVAVVRVQRATGEFRASGHVVR